MLKRLVRHLLARGGWFSLWLALGLGAAAAGVHAKDCAPPLIPVVWSPRFEGVELTQLQLTEPRQLSLVAARVDLRAPGLRWLATPPAEPGSAPLAPPRIATLKFASGRTRYLRAPNARSCARMRS